MQHGTEFRILLENEALVQNPEPIGFIGLDGESASIALLQIQCGGKLHAGDIRSARLRRQNSGILIR